MSINLFLPAILVTAVFGVANAHDIYEDPFGQYLVVPNIPAPMNLESEPMDLELMPMDLELEPMDVE